MRIIVIFIIYGFIFSACQGDIDDESTSILIFSKTEGYRHKSIETGIDSIKIIGERNGMEVYETEDASFFEEKNLQSFACVIFLSTTGDVLNDDQQGEFKRYIQAGGSFFGIHAAADTEYNWPWYGKLVGAYFNGHPGNPNVRNADIQLVADSHESCAHLPKVWNRADEWYNFKNINPDINVLLNLDETSYEGGTNGKSHPIAWCHEYDGGRAFYTGLGHTIESFAEADFIKHLEGAIKYCVGDETGPDYSLANVTPADNRFEKVVLDQNLKEPMELALLPNKEILFIERGGGIKLYDPKQKKTIKVANMKVHTEFEDGLLGLAVDPNYKSNNWIYLFYSPVGDEAIQHVSRFDFKDQKIDMESEKVILKIPVQREQCCHSAGSVEFGPDGYMFISVGDNTNPFKSSGFSPSDEREGRKPFDAQRSSANTNDFRGKILRIKLDSDAGYSIPDGNLFPKDGSEGKPEIYVMGCRNPFRYCIDPKTKYLYWGDVGPDAGEDKEERGPRGHDEVNQARKPGFFGWPYFVGDNKAYRKFDFSTEVSGEARDPKHPINSSPNNTGIKELPEAQKAFIWYPYASSEEFPLVGDGGRNAMAGFVYYSDMYNGENKLPAYFDGKLIIYEWMRNWFMAVTMDENGDFESMERMMPSQTFNNPIDVLISPEGEFYVLEYGTGWFTQNIDARLVKMQYTAGNRKPLAKLDIDQNIGSVPMTLALSAAESLDYDGDELSYEWFLDGKSFSKDAKPSLKIEEAGKYDISLTVKDSKGNTNQSSTQVMAGNEAPKVTFNVEGNSSFYFPGKPVNYNVTVMDKEDGSIGKGIDSENILVTINYLKDGFDRNEIAMGHAQGLANMDAPGKLLIGDSDCQSCHKENMKSVGPSYQDIAKKYRNDKSAPAYLAERIIKGGNGVWGDLAMAAHPQLELNDVDKMVEYILSIKDSSEIKTYPASGVYNFNEQDPKKRGGVYVLTSSYKDKGAGEVASLTAQDVQILRNAHFSAVDVDDLNKAETKKLKGGQIPGIRGGTWILIGNNGSSAVYKSIDLTGINSMDLEAYCTSPSMSGGTIELRAESANGKLIDKKKIMSKVDAKAQTLTFDLSKFENKQDLYLVFKSSDGSKPTAGVTYLHFKS